MSRTSKAGSRARARRELAGSIGRGGGKDGVFVTLGGRGGGVVVRAGSVENGGADIFGVTCRGRDVTGGGEDPGFCPSASRNRRIRSSSDCVSPPRGIGFEGG